ncbi:MAG: GntR family transcriptional regulator [Roseibium sp.]|uniref:GntR family transcriptional regulator n=1 Tax=Roseibium sp. TaxID=1936156 RepID=UPI001B117E81|nr:GntR family transcriptional regulator [Roseibium sp.]MBO6894874.1 GntR family transcriptional regulator [Roseibium sp.]MBO6930076.1 GntR family transcriptional regulator [Roseibium sp.]
MTLSNEQDIEEYVLPDISKLSGSLAQRVYEALRQSILEMHLPPGTALKKQVICEQLGVSRSPVTEAITKLAGEGLVEVIPQSGSRVTRFSMPEIREGAFLREAIELAAVAKVAAERTEDQMTALTRNLRLQALCLEDNDEAGFFREDEHMHELIFAFTGYPKLNAIADTGWIQVNRARLLLLPLKGRAQSAYDEHKLIISAIRDKDPERARKAMQDHLSTLVVRLEPLSRERPDLFD